MRVTFVCNMCCGLQFHRSGRHMPEANRQPPCERSAKRRRLQEAGETRAGVDHTRSSVAAAHELPRGRAGGDDTEDRSEVHTESDAGEGDVDADGSCAASTARDDRRVLHMSRILVVEDGHLRPGHAADYAATPQAPTDPPTQAPHDDEDDSGGDGANATGAAAQVQARRSRLIASPRSMKHFIAPESEAEALAADVISYLGRAFVDGRFRHSPANREWMCSAMHTLAGAVVRLARADPRKRGAVVHLRSPLFVLGDLHGDFADMLFFMQRLTVLGDVRYTPHGFLLLGDYVDRGRWGVEVCAYVMALRCLSPGTVTMLRGNHDDPMVNSAVTEYATMSFRYQCYAFCMKSKEAGTALHVACNKVFKALPLAAVVDGTLFCAHGGIPRYDGGADDRMAVLEDPQFPELPYVYPRCLDPATASPAEKQMLYAWDLMWSDPYDDSDDDSSPTHTEHGFGFNIRGGSTVSYTSHAVRTFLTNHGFSCLVRGHQERPVGARLSHEGQVLTLFSTSGYCGHTNNAAAALYNSDGTFSYVTKGVE